MKLLAATACSVPIVVIDLRDLADVAPRHGCGPTVPPDGPAAIAAAVAIRDPDPRSTA